MVYSRILSLPPALGYKSVKNNRHPNEDAGREDLFEANIAEGLWGPVSGGERCRTVARCVGLRDVTHPNSTGLRAATMTNAVRVVRTQKASSEAKRATGPYRMLPYRVLRYPYGMLRYRYQTWSARERRKRCEPAYLIFKGSQALLLLRHLCCRRGIELL